MRPFRKSSLDVQREVETPNYIEGEELIKWHQASYDVGGGFQQSWKFGHLCLTKKSICFENAGKVVFKLPYRHLFKISVVERLWILGKVIKQLYIVPRAGTGKKAYYIGISNPERWEREIQEQLLMTEDRGQN